MASYHFSMKTSKNCAAGAGVHFDYIAREGRYAKGEKAEELVYKKNGNMPSWAQQDAGEFWRAADVYERANGTTYREIELALPNELTLKEQIELTDQFTKAHLGEEFTYSYAIHANDARLAKNVEQAFNASGEIKDLPNVPVKNPHVHIVFCERKLDGIERSREQFFKRANTKHPELGGAKKEARWNDKNRAKNLQKMREDWAVKQNEALARAGHAHVKVDHRTLEEQRAEALARGDVKKAQELDRAPEQHLGPKVVSFPKTHHVVLRNSDKVRYVMLSREYKNTLQQIEACQRRIDELKNHQQEPAKERETNREINMTVREIKDLCNARMKEIGEQVDALRIEYRELQKAVIAPERAQLMAESIFSKGETKRLNIEHRSIDEQREKYKTERDAYLAKPAPKFYQLEDKREHEQEGERLVNWKRELAQRVAAYEEKRAVLDEKLSQPTAKEQIAKIKESILQKNEPQRLKAESVKARAEGLKDEKVKLAEIRSKANYVRNENSTVRVQQPRGQTVEPVARSRSLLEQAADVAKQLDVAKNGRTNGLRARINIDDDDNEPGRGKRYKL